VDELPESMKKIHDWVDGIRYKIIKADRQLVRMTWWDLFLSVKLIMREIAVETPLCKTIDIITIISKETWSHVMKC
jgi:hypothetical protein